MTYDFEIALEKLMEDEINSRMIREISCKVPDILREKIDNKTIIPYFEKHIDRSNLVGLSLSMVEKYLVSGDIYFMHGYLMSNDLEFQVEVDGS